MVTITLKQEINAVLKRTGHPHFYGRGNSETFPYIRYTLGNNSTGRLSNRKAIRNIWYQIDVFSMVPLAVQSDTLLLKIEDELEAKNLYTTDWIESIDDDNNTRYNIYHYFIEVRE